MQPSRHLLAALVTASVFFGATTLAHAAGSGLAGDYHIHGQNPDGRPYEGALHVEQKGNVYGVTWESGGTTHGIGVLAGNQLVVAYGDAACGVIAYRREGAGSLEGTWAVRNSTATGHETATPSASGGTSVAGDYVVSGSNADNTPYKGALFVNDQGDEHKLLFGWRTGQDAQGFGFTHQGVIAAAFGPPSCGLVAYTLGADRALDGRWSMLKGGFGSEQARKTD
jgi:hypothetical protein